MIQRNEIAFANGLLMISARAAIGRVWIPNGGILSSTTFGKESG
jgi:hypothetical protein